MIFAQLSQDSMIVIVGMAVCGSLSGAVVFLFGINQKQNLRTQDKLEKFAEETKVDLKECRDDRELLHSKIHDLAVQFAQVRREQT